MDKAKLIKIIAIAVVFLCAIALVRYVQVNRIGKWGTFSGTYILNETIDNGPDLGAGRRYGAIAIQSEVNNPNNYYYHEIHRDSEIEVYRGTFLKLSDSEYLLLNPETLEEEKVVLEGNRGFRFEKSGDFYKKDSESFIITPEIKSLVDADVDVSADAGADSSQE